MVAGHVVRDISCLDRLYLSGYVAKLQTPGRVVYFPHDHPPPGNMSYDHPMRRAASDYAAAAVFLVLFAIGGLVFPLLSPPPSRPPPPWASPKPASPPPP